MGGKSILFADADGKALEEFCGILGPQWRVCAVSSGMAAMTEMQRHPCDVVVACIDLPELDGAELLNHIRVAYPETIRFITAPGEMRERLISEMVGGHQFLAKPFERATLKSTIQRSLSAGKLIVNSGLRELVGRIRTFPTIPSLYLEVISALNNPNATTEEIGAIVAKDMGMTTKMLQVLNSAYFSLPQSVTDPAEAVGLLGFETVKSLIMSVQLMSQYDKIKPVYFSVDSIWRHSTSVAWIAKQFAILEVGDPVLAASAYTAGLMHDVGKVILAANFDHQYSGAHALARKQQMPLWEIEKEIFGASHGEIGAYLFGLWGMPADIIEAAAFHHHPSRIGEKTFSPLTAVHVANVLEYEGNPNTQGLIPPVLDMEYLSELGLADRLDMWRDAVAHTHPLPAPAPSRPMPISSTATALVSSEPARNWKPMLYGGLVLAAVAFLFCCWEFQRPDPPADYAEIVQSAPIPAAIPKPAAIAPPVVKPPPAPIIAPVSAPIKPSAAEMAFNDLKLQGIFFSARNPSAILDGKLTRANGFVGAFHVIEIKPNSVTVEFQGRRRIISLR